MALKYASYERLFASRRKGNEHKPIYKSCRLFKNGDNFEVRYKSREQLLYTITPADVVTLHGNGDVMTFRRLMGLAVDTSIYSNTAGHRNKTHTIRMHVRGESKPYAPGIQVRLNPLNRDSHEYSNFPVDMARTVTNDAKNMVKGDTTKIRKLVKVMTRLGVFDEIARKGLNGWGGNGEAYLYGQLKTVNYKDPVGEDAETVFRVGLSRCNCPHQTAYINGVWSRVDEAERLSTYKTRAVEAGLRALRKSIYSTTEGSYELTPVHPKAD